MEARVIEISYIYLIHDFQTDKKDGERKDFPNIKGFYQIGYLRCFCPVELQPIP